MFVASYRNTMKNAKPAFVNVLPAMKAEKREIEAKIEAEKVATCHKATRHLPEWIAEIIHATAEKHGIDICDLMGGSRTWNVGRARHEAYYRVKERKPALSLNQIGKFFQRDHTSILFGLAAHAERSGEHDFTGFSLERNRTRNRDAARERDRRVKAERRAKRNQAA
jgi:chromosomal replication initiation ATPase DnaA